MKRAIPHAVGFHMIHPPILILNRVNVGANEDATIDLSSYLPYEARYAVLLVEFLYRTLVTENWLKVEHIIYDNIDDYNEYARLGLTKEAGQSIVQILPNRYTFIVKLADRTYFYEIAGTWNSQTVNCHHWLLGYFA